MLGKVLAMDLKRGFCRWRFIAAVVTAALLLFVSSWSVFAPAFSNLSPQTRGRVGAIDLMFYAMGFDVFKIVIALILSGLYAGGFCRDVTSSYLRQILSRTDVLTYTRSKFAANLIVILIASIASCIICCVIYMALGFPIISHGAQGGLLGTAYYTEIMVSVPIVYIAMNGLQFGMVIAACSSIGMLLSAYQANAFVCIGSSGFLFLILLSLSYKALNGTPFDALTLVSMQSVFPKEYQISKGMMFAWGMMYPGVVIMLCCLLFERRMKWRAEHGII